MDYKAATKLLSDNNIAYTYFNEEEKLLHKMPIGYNKNQNIIYNFANCFYANSYFYIKNGILYPCTLMANVNHFNEKFGKNIALTNKDYLIIKDIKSEDEILNFISTPKPVCAYCKIKNMEHNIKWERSNRQIDEWT